MQFVVAGKRRGKVLVLFAVLAALSLPGAKCHHEPAPQYVCGPSSNVQPVAGAGVSWSYGQFPYNAGQFAGDLFNQVNLFRTSRNLSSLKWHDGLALVAQEHASDMFTNKYLSLVSRQGVTMCQMLVSSTPRIDFDNAYDFVGYTPVPPAGSTEVPPTAMFTSMVNDPSAETVMMDPSITHFGASFQANPGPYYVAVIFGVNVRP